MIDEVIAIKLINLLFYFMSDPHEYGSHVKRYPNYERERISQLTNKSQ